MIEHFPEFLKKMQVLKKDSGKFVKGEWREGSESTVDAVMIPSLLPKDFLNHQSEGEYTAQDRAFYKQAKTEFSKNDVVLYDNKKYKIADIAERENELLTVYYCKKMETAQ